MQTDRSSTERQPVRVLCLVLLCVACAAAAYQGIRATHDLTFPADEDFARDVAAAETIADGHPLSDPVYRGEWLWYNPLAPTIVAAIARASGQPIPLVYSRVGAYFNLLAPLALFALVTVWWGWLRALVAMLALLYLVPGEGPGWLTASYSPWFYPMHVGQALFYLALLAITIAWRTGRMRAFALSGFALGATLLAHSAPMLLLCGAMFTEAVRTEWRDATGLRRRLMQTQWAMAHGLVTIVPTHHFWYYLTALTAIVFACGIGALADGIQSLGGRAGKPVARMAPYAMPALTALVVLAAILRYPAFTRRFDFAKAPITARQMFSDPDLHDMYRWLRRSTKPDDVVFAPINLGQSVIGISGRKLVVVGKFFSNPYVNWGTRAEDSLAMDRYLRVGDFDGFLAIASRYRVRYIARNSRLPDQMLKDSLLSLAWSSGPWVIYKLGR